MKVTVALPVWNSKEIAWLCMESLCNQKVDFEWELLVFEEKHPQQLGRDYFKSYQSRLPGCTIRYLTRNKWISLSEKWAIMGMVCEGEYMCLCAADNYYHPYMLTDAMTSGADWFITTRGYFYDIDYQKMLIYNALLENVGLQMTASKRVISGLPMQQKKRSIDNWVFNNLEMSLTRKDTSTHWEGTLCTNGMNNISHKRHKFFKEVKYPFRQTSKTLYNIVPEYIADRLISLK